MQTECRISSLLGYYAEVQLILCKDNANRMQNEINVFISLLRCSLSYAKIMHLILPPVVRIDFYTFIFAMRGCGVIPESFSVYGFSLRLQGCKCPNDLYGDCNVVNLSA